jgi:endonuclease YncB( thermonuclease family)
VLGAAILATILLDPCTFVPDRGPTPEAVRRGRTVSGEVVHIIDGDGLCIDLGDGTGDGNDWLEIRLADYDAPELNQHLGRETKELLTRITLGRRLTCRLGRRSWDRVIGACTIDDRPLGDVMRAEGGREGGR